MKLHLPAALLASLLMCGVANANGLYERKDTITVEQDSTLKLTDGTEAAENACSTLSKEGYTYNKDDATPGAIVKDGSGELVIDKELTMNNPFVIDQGKVSIKDVAVKAERSSSNYTSGLSIADATLELDNASFTSEVNGYSFCVGNRDGGASKLVLKNNSTVKTFHYLFAGYAGNANTDYRAGLDAEAATGDAIQRAEIQVLSGSELSAGSSLQFANADVTVDGAGSVLRDNHRGQTKNQWPESYFAYGAGYETKIDVTGGGLLDLNWDVYTSRGENSRTVINVTGTGVDEDGKTVASEISVAGTALLSMVDDYNYTDSTATNKGAYTELNITEGAKADISQLVMGVDAGEAKVTIGSGSSYLGVIMRVGANGTLDNSGTLNLETGNTTKWPTDGKSSYSECVTEKQAGTLTVESGTVVNSGSMTVEKLELIGTADSRDAVVTNTKGTFWVKNDARIEQAELCSKLGEIRFDAVATVKDSKFTAEGGNIHFNKGANLKGGNEFTTNGTAEKLYFGGTTTAEGDNSFNGQIKMNNLVVKSGNQKFENSTQQASMSFASIGFANDADDTAAISISSSSGSVNLDNCVISGMEARTTSVVIENTLTVKDSLVLGEGSCISFNDIIDRKYQFTVVENGQNRTFNLFKNVETGEFAFKYTVLGGTPADMQIWVLNDNATEVVEKIAYSADAWKAYSGNNVTQDRENGPITAIHEAKLIFEIDSLSELVDAPVSTFQFNSGESESPMLVLGDEVELDDNARVELLFTENALAELEEYEGPLTLNLDKVTNATGLEISLDVAEEFGKSVEEVFGTTTITTGTYGSGDNSFTINAVPEPTTATLSLLALMGLVARRRRK